MKKYRKCLPLSASRMQCMPRFAPNETWLACPVAIICVCVCMGPGVSDGFHHDISDILFSVQVTIFGESAGGMSVMCHVSDQKSDF